MTNGKMNRLRTTIIYSLGIIIFTSMIGLSLKMELKTIIFAIMGQIFLTYIPGVAFFNLIYRKKQNLLNELILSYAFGYVINILEYLVSYLLFSKTAVVITTAIVSFVSIIYMIFAPDKRENLRMFEISASDILFLVLFGVITFFSYAAVFLSPSVLEGSIFYNRDIQYWVNNSVSLSIGFPPENVFADGFPLKYHYFSSLHIAFMSMLTGIDIFNLSFGLYTFGKTILYVGGVICLFDSLNIKGSKKMAYMIIFLFCTGIEDIAAVTYTPHSILAPFGCDLGIAFGFLFLSEFIRQIDDEKIDIGILITSIFFCFACTGEKGPIATVLLVFPGYICLNWLFRKRILLCFSYGISLVIAYLVVSVGCLGILDVASGNSSSWKMSIYSITDIGRYNLFENNYLNALVSIGIRFFCMNPALVILFCISCILFVGRFKSYPKKQQRLGIAAILCAIVGLGFWQLINAGGSSEMYFAFAAYIPMLILCSVAGFEILSYTITHVVYCLLVLFGIYQFAFCGHVNNGVLVLAQQGLKNICGIYSTGQEEVSSTIQATDIQALDWIRCNTPKDSVMLTDRAVLTENPAYYYYAMFCERQMYLEGSNMLRQDGEVGEELERRRELIRQVFKYNSEEALLESSKYCDYLIQTKWVSPYFHPNTDLVELVYSSGSINVYKYNRKGAVK